MMISMEWLQIPLSFYVWVSVVLVQFVVHYAVISPRSKFREEDDLEILTEEQEDEDDDYADEAKNTDEDSCKNDTRKMAGSPSSQELQHLPQDSKSTNEVSLSGGADSTTDDQEQISHLPLHTILTSNKVNTADAGDNSTSSLITSSVMVRLDSHNNPADDNDRFEDDEDNDDSFDIPNDIGTDMSPSSWEDEIRGVDDDKFRYELLKHYYSSAFDGDNGDSTDNVYNVPQNIQDITFENGRIKWAIKKKTQNHKRRNLLKNKHHGKTTLKTKQLLTAITQLSQ